MYKKIVLAALMVMLSGTAANAKELYVLPNAASGGDGSINAPFATLAEAKAAVQSMNASQTEDIYVYLMDGTYTLDSTLTFTASDSGKNGYRVIYKAYEGANPTISGGKQITSEWIPVDTQKNIWRTEVSGTDTRQLYVNGEKATRARTEDGEVPSLTATDTGYTVDTSSELLSFTNVADVEFAYDYAFLSSRVGVASISSDGIITMDDKFSKLGSNALKITHIENAYELMDEPGEWYLDSDAGYLFYIPRSGEEMNGDIEVVMPVLERLISFNSCSDVVLSGIDFKYTTWLYPTDNSYIGNQGGINPEAVGSPWTDTVINYAVYSQYSSEISIEDCTFSELGGGGVRFGVGAQDSIVTGCEVYNCAAGGVYYEEVRRGGPNETQKIKNNTISYSKIHDIGTEYHSCTGIFVGFAQNTLIQNNEVYNTPYTGISIGWGWNDNGSDPVFKTDATSRDNKVYRNLVHDCMLTLTDGGGIYSLGAQPGMEIQGNVVHTIGHTTGAYDEIAYYLDDGSRFITMTDNIGYGAWRPLYIKGKYNVSTGNYFDMAIFRPESGADATCVVDNTVVTDGSYPTDIISLAGATAETEIKVFIKGTTDPNKTVLYGLFNKSGVAKSEDIFYINDCTSDSKGSYTVELTFDLLDIENTNVNTSETDFESSISSPSGSFTPYEFYDIYDAQFVEGTDEQGNAKKALVSVFSGRNTGKESICLAACLYDGEGRLLKVQTEDFTSFSSDIFTVDVTGYTGEYKVKIMMWDSVNGMVPLTEFLPFTSSGE